MRVFIDVPAYTSPGGLRLEWDQGFEVRAHMVGDDLILSANVAGLRSLARHFLALAQEVVPSGTHVHLDDSNSLEDGSTSLVLERL